MFLSESSNVNDGTTIFFKLFVCNAVHTSPVFAILVPIWLIIFFLVFYASVLGVFFFYLKLVLYIANLV